MANISDIKAQAEKALRQLSEGKLFFLRDVNDRLQKTAEMYPQDTVIVAVSQVIGKANEKHPEELISQGEIEKVYNELSGLNASGTRFREILGDLLLTQSNFEPQVKTDYINKIRDTEEEPISIESDSEAKKELDSLFTASQKYEQGNVKSAKSKVESQLTSFGFNNASVNLEGGNSKFLLFAAHLDTNNGKAKVLIPVNASGEEFPEVFVAGNKIEEFSLPAIYAYLSKVSENTLSVDQNYSEMQTPKASLPEELKQVLPNTEERILEASLGYPAETVRMTKEMLVTELSSMGFKGAQIRIHSSTNDGFICEATINTPTGRSSFEVPIEMKGNSPLFPTVFAKGDFIAEFNTKNLRSFAMSGVESSSIIRQESDLDLMDISQLKDTIVRSAMAKDFDTCVDALDTIGNKCDTDTYKQAILDYQKVLVNLENMKNSIASSYEDKDQFVLTPNSMYPIHKKLGRPAHELIKDENGEYHLKSSYLSKQNQKTSSVLFNTAKVLIGE